MSRHSGGGSALCLALARAPSLTSTGAARAETVDATTTTLLVGRQDMRDGVLRTSVPVFELVSLRATDLRVPGVDGATVILSGWGAVAFGDPALLTDDKRGLGDLDLAFAEGTLLRRH